jgi:lysine 6-dehydrogenase
MRMLVLGAGQQGSACAFDLLARTDSQVVLADRNLDDLPSFLEPYVGGRLELRRLDAESEGDVRDAMQGVATTMSALPYYFNFRMAAAALEAGSHFCDLGGNTEIVLEQKGLHEAARARELSLVADCGLAPGLVNILAESGIRRLDHAREVFMKVGGLPQHPEPPLNYQVVYSLEGVLDYYTTLSWILRDGVPVQMEALSEVEDLEFPGVGRLEAFHTAGGLSLMAQAYEGKLERMEYKTLRYPGHAHSMRTIRDLGLLSSEPVEVKGQQVVPRDLFIAVATPRIAKAPQESPDLVVLRVEACGERDGRRTTLRWDLLDRFDPRTGITAMMRTTGFSLAITGTMQAQRRIAPGAWVPSEIVPAEEYLNELRDRGIEVEYTEEG